MLMAVKFIFWVAYWRFAAQGWQKSSGDRKSLGRHVLSMHSLLKPHRSQKPVRVRELPKLLCISTFSSRLARRNPPASTIGEAYEEWL